MWLLSLLISSTLVLSWLVSWVKKVGGLKLTELWESTSCNALWPKLSDAEKVGEEWKPEGFGMGDEGTAV